MTEFYANLTEFEEWRYNLLLINPGKGEAKKTVGQGFIRVDGVPGHLDGYATDDILSVAASLDATPVQDHNFRPTWWTAEALKSAEVYPVLPNEAERVHVKVQDSLDFDAKFDRLFWVEHVLSSIVGDSDPVSQYHITISPDRLRKMSLLKPQGHPMWWNHVEWADRDLIRWYYRQNLKGVYVPLDGYAL